MEIFKIFLAIIGLAMSFGYYPQIYKMWKNKSSENISLPTYAIFSLGTLTYLIYGILTKDSTLITSFILGVLGSWTVLILILVYRKK